MSPARPDTSGKTASRLRDAAPLFAALGDETRLGLLSKLSTGERSIAQLTEGTGVTRQAVTKHLGVLERAGLVESAFYGRETIWQLLPHRFEDARKHLESISRQWDRALGRLQDLVDD